MRRAIVALLVLWVWCATGRAEFTPPADNVVTEEQLKNYLGAMKDWMAAVKAAGQAIDKSGGGFGALAVAARADEKMKTIMADHHLAEGEFEWVGGKVFEAWGGLMMQDASQQAGKEIDKQLKETDARIEEQKKIIEDREAAKTAGRRVLNEEERAAAIERAKEKQQSAREEEKSQLDAAKARDEEAKTAADEAKKALKDAAEAEKLAQKPPADVAADDRQSYMDEKKQAAKDATEQASAAEEREKEARTAEAEAKKAAQQAAAEAEAAGKLMEDPSAIATDDEKAELLKQHEEAIASARQQLDLLVQQKQLLTEATASYTKQMAETSKDVPKANIDLLSKYRKEWEAVWQDAKTSK